VIVSGADRALAQAPAAPADAPATQPATQPAPATQPGPAAPATQPQPAPPYPAQPAYPTQPAYPNNYPQTYPNNYPQTYPQNAPRQNQTYPSPAYHAYVPPPPPEESRGCCLWSLRYDPFDLLFRRVTFNAEIAWGKLPFTTEITPKYIFNSPSNDLKEQGFDMGVNIGWYPGGQALRGLWVKAHAEYESFRSTLTRKVNDAPQGKGNPELCDQSSDPGTCSRRVGSVILGLMVGSTYVFGRNGGFAISGGIGIGAAVAQKKQLEVLPCSASDVANKDPNCSVAETADSSSFGYAYYDEAARIRLLGTLGLGIAF